MSVTWTQADLDAAKLRLRRDFGKPVEKPEDKIIPSRKPKALTKLERDFWEYLKVTYPFPNVIHVQAVRLLLSNACTYLGDFMVEAGKPIIFETKGQHRFREKGIIKLKMAANKYRCFRFILVTREKGVWKQTEIFPAL